MTDVFKGNIGIGTLVVKFLSDFSNHDPDSLVATYADDNGGNAQARHKEIAPGGAGDVQITAPAPGLFEALVRTGHDDESGRLQVSRNGTLVHDEPIKGPTRWFYVVSA